MRTLLPFVIASLLTVSTAAFGQSSKSIKSAPKSPAEVSAWHAGKCRKGDSVRVGERVVWCGARRISEVVWSRSRHAVAFATRDRHGLSLHVAFVGGIGAGTLLTWPATMELRKGQRPEVSWLSHNRVAMGRTIVRPQLVASWNLRQM